MERGDHTDTGLSEGIAPAEKPKLNYTISADGKSITCKKCGRISNHPKDVEHKWCAHCHVFHDDEHGHNSMDSANHFSVGVTARGTLSVSVPMMGAMGRVTRIVYLTKAEAINLAAWLKVLADPGGKEFERMEAEVRKPVNQFTVDHAKS